MSHQWGTFLITSYNMQNNCYTNSHNSKFCKTWYLVSRANAFVNLVQYYRSMMHFRTNFEQCVIDSRTQSWIIWQQMEKKNLFLIIFFKTNDQNPELRLPESITNLRIYIYTHTTPLPQSRSSYLVVGVGPSKM